VQDSKKNATEALGQVSQIRQLIEEANDNTIRAQQALAGAELSAIHARDTAKEAQTTYADQATQVPTRRICFHEVQFTYRVVFFVFWLVYIGFE